MERWAAGDAYERFMGRWSRDVAKEFLRWLQPPANAAWLDVGCGTGALASTIATADTIANTTAAPTSLGVGVDPSLDFVRYAAQQNTQTRFAVSNALALPIIPNAFDVVVSGLALNFIPHPADALREFVRVAKPGATVAAYVWDYAGKMEFLRYFWDAAVALDADAAALHEGQRFPLCHAAPLQQLWQEAGLEDVTVQAIDVATPFADFESYWQPFTLGNFPAPQYALALDEPQRATLKQQLQSTIPTAADGSLQLIARAWAVRGRKASLPRLSS